MIDEEWIGGNAYFDQDGKFHSRRAVDPVGDVEAERVCSGFHVAMIRLDVAQLLLQ